MSRLATNAILEQINESFRVKEDILPYIPTPLHYHPHYELVWIRKSTGLRIVGDHIDRFQDDDMVLMGPNLPHVWENDKEYYAGDPHLKVDVYVVHFTEDILRDLMRFPELTDMKQIFALSQRGLRIVGEANRQLREVIAQLYRSTSFERMILFLRIFQILHGSTNTQLLSSANFARFFNGQDSDRLRKIYEYIGKNFARNIQLEEISAVACLSPTAFCRYFKQKTGQSFISYLNNFRLGYARNLLDSKTYKISTVAEMCGFQDISYFNRIFKQCNKMTPTAYIQRMQTD
ncbi:AraC family transcriptional regulator [Parabacteroides sp. OttesenSCG-928-K15]|nr:AraC family transcriptional regulator [Parabacteroides sp. OttesenSCG-928-K15]